MKSIGYYVGSPASDALQERYGARLEEMTIESLVTFNAVVATFAMQYRLKESIDPPAMFNDTTNRVAPLWRDHDPEAYNHCLNFCTETIEGRYIAAHNLVPMCKAIAEAIQCHMDY